MTREWKLPSGPTNGLSLQVPSWLRTSKARYLVVATLVSVSLVYFLLYTTATGFKSWHDVKLPGSKQHSDGDSEQAPHDAAESADLTAQKHPIDDLILTGRANWQRTLSRRSNTVHEAAKKYRQKRGRHPPPGFDQWFEYAQNHSSVVVEEFFDRIYHDLNPFWAIEPKVLRFQANAWDFVVSVRNGNSTYKTDNAKRVPWIQLWAGLIKDLEDRLPDLDMPVNMMDESRLVVPWEDIDRYMHTANAKRFLMDPLEVIPTYASRDQVDQEKTDEVIPFDPQFHGGQYWELAKAGCHPNSTSRNAPAWAPLEEPTLFPSGRPQNSSEGFVSNWTLARQICDKPYLRGLHGSFIEPVSVSTSNKLIPLFGGSKLPINNEILIPPATYLNSDPKYSGGSAHGSFWWSKNDGVIWRGVASGGRNKAENWSHFQRHRFVQMMNGTRVKQAETLRLGRAETFDLPTWEDYNLKAVRNGYLGDWLSEITDVAFTELLCFPGTGAADRCPYTEQLFEVKHGMPMPNMYKYKYLPDIDGNSFSGRYRAFLLSTSLPIKATIYSEWHDDRLAPWVHFVPMDNTYQDIYGILDYFMGYEGLGAHDEMAEKIAMDGKEWAEKSLRREDMAVYTYRLLLEWARICDDDRVSMGWVEDLLRGMRGENEPPM